MEPLNSSTDIFSLDFINTLIKEAIDNNTLTTPDKLRIAKLNQYILPQSEELQKLSEQHLNHFINSEKKVDDALLNYYFTVLASYKKSINKYIKNKNNYEVAVARKEKIAQILGLYINYILYGKLMQRQKKYIQSVKAELSKEDLQYLEENERIVHNIHLSKEDKYFVKDIMENLQEREASLLDRYETARENYKQAKYNNDKIEMNLYKEVMRRLINQLIEE